MADQKPNKKLRCCIRTLMAAMVIVIFSASAAHAEITFVNAGTEVKVGSGNMASVGIPAGIQNNDILVVVVHQRDNVDSTILTDWTPKVQGNGNSTNRLEVWWKRTTGSEPPPTVARVGGNSGIAVMLAFRGAVTSGDPFDAVGSVQSNSGSPISTTSITTNVDEAMVLHLFGSQDNNDWGSYTGIPTNEATQLNNTSGGDNSLGLAYAVQSSKGATGAAGASQTKFGPDAGASVQMALKPLPTLTLANHSPSGQITDQLTTSSPDTQVFFRFNLSDCSEVTVTQIKVNFTTGGGIANGDVADGELWLDNNDDGAIDGGDTQLGDNVTPVSGVLTFDALSQSPDAGKNYLVRATLSNLVSGDATTFSMTFDDITVSEGGVTKSGTVDNVAHTQDLPTLTLGNHTLNQVGDLFTDTTPVTDVLFRFNLDRNDLTVTIDALRVQYTTGGGVSDGDVTAAELWEDADSDGVIDDPGDTLIENSVNGASGQLNFNSFTPFSPGTSGTDYLVKVTVSNLIDGDSTTFSLGTADIDEVQGSVDETGTITDATHTQDFLTAIYYSVGTETGALYSDTAAASNGTLTLDSAAVTNIGVGDEVREGSNRYYITGRNSATEFTIQNSAANGGTPGATNITFTTTSITIYRAFNSLAAAEANSDDASHLNTANLVANNFQLNWACYKDGPDPSNQVQIGASSWVTGADYYIRIYTPTDSSEVGTSQRHDGTEGTGYRIAPADSAPGSYFNFIWISVDNGYVHLEGLELDGSGVTNGQNLRGFHISGSSQQDVRISHCLIHDIVNGSTGTVRAVNLSTTSNAVISNNIFYNITTVSTDSGDYATAIEGSYNTQYVYNNTIYNIKNTGSGGGWAYGINDDGGSTLVAKNNYAGLVDSTNGSEACFSGTFSQESYNISSDATATGTGSLTNKAPADQFVSTTAGSEDLHLKAGADCIGRGDDLSATFIDDIDGETRYAGAGLWDVGADEFYTAGGAPSCEVDPNGTYFEAENYTQMVDGALNGTFTEESSQAGYIGDGYLKTGGADSGQNGQRVDYTVEFASTGDYYVWLRVYMVNNGADSIFVGLDGTYVSVWDPMSSDHYNEWFWLGTAWPSAPKVTVGSTGEHTINLWVREPNMLIDAIYVTTDSGTIPGGTSGGIPTGATVIDPSNCGTCSSNTFAKYRTITIQDSKVEADLTDFPVLVMLTGTEFQTIEDDVTDADGDDIIFRESYSGDQLSHEIEAYDTSNDLLVAWVKIPVLSGSSPTTIYMWYGNECIVDSTAYPADVWSNGYKAVWHLKEAATDEGAVADNHADSTSYNRYGDQNGNAATDGKFAGAQNFDGTNDRIDICTTDCVEITGEITVSAWINAAVAPSSMDNYARIVSKWYSWSAGGGYGLFLQNTNNGIRMSTADSDSDDVAALTFAFSTDTWYYVVGTWQPSSGQKGMYVNEDGVDGDKFVDSSTNTETVYSVDIPLTIGDAPSTNFSWYGKIDEVRISSVARSQDWINTEYRNQSDPASFYTLGEETAATAVDLVYFAATGDGNAVKVEWQTAREFDNVGFHIYRAESAGGPYARITNKLISANPQQSKGGHYSYTDADVSVGRLYYYKLEDIDVRGKHTLHGPVCVDWDADGMPDDWEIAHGLNPWVDDADIDSDGDGLSNIEEYERSTDPFNPDSDGDGILDGDENGRLAPVEDPGARQLSRGVEVIEQDETGMTLELVTSGFDADVVTAGGREFEQLKISDYVHGYTGQPGAPQLPLKGILIDVPSGSVAQLTVLSSAVEPYYGYRIYPVPEDVLDEQGGTAAVGQQFVQDQAAYDIDGFYPQVVAGLGQSYVLREQIKQQLLFYPLSFNAASGQLNFYPKIRVRIDFVDAAYAQIDSPYGVPWQPPKATAALLAPVAVGLAASPLLANPISPLLSSLGAALAAVWSPPEGSGSAVYKIMTAAEGIHHIDRDFLTAQGLDAAAIDAIDLAAVRLYNLGQEVAVYIEDQATAGQLDAGDFIEFYAPPVAAAYTKYSAENVFWLTSGGGAGPPKRMGSIDATPAFADPAADFGDTLHHEQNQMYWLKAPGADSLERWVSFSFVKGDEHAGGGLPVPFVVSVPDPLSLGTLKISMAGQTATEHRVRVAVNGAVQDFVWAGISYHEAIISDVNLNAGDNTVTLQCLSSDGNDVIAVDWFEITYRRDYAAVANQLKFTPDAGSRYVIEDFTSNSLRAYDISDPTDAALLEGAVIGGAGPFSIDIEPAVFGDTYFVVAADAINAPDSLAKDTASTLFDQQNGADYILITHREIGWDGNGDALPWLEDLTALRQAQGLRVFVADIQDIYDEFSYGVAGPQALKDFLSYAYSSWTAPAPQYVLLVGDSTYDPKDLWLNADTTAYLPARLIFTDYKGETVSDDWFVTVSGDDAVADMHIGRLPAATAAQAAAMVAKIIAYETTANTKFVDADAWEKNILLIADNQREGDGYAYEAAFAAMNDADAELLPAAMSADRGYLGIHYANAAFLNDFIVTSLNTDGALMVNYSGHGATQIWATENIFDAADAAALSNFGELPFFVSMSCETGIFFYPHVWGFDSLAEALLRSDAGAVAAFMPTGMTTTEGQQILNNALFEAIFTEDVRTLGPAIAAAKQTLLANGDAYYEQIAATFMLFGDPATTLKVPLPYRPANVDVRQQHGRVRISWDASVDTDGDPVTGYNVYRAASAAGPFSRINTELITATVFFDTDAGAGIAADKAVGSAGSSYYMVTAVDSLGDESVQSLAVKPAAVAEAASGLIGCFISTSTGTFLVNGWALVVIFTAALCVWYKVLPQNAGFRVLIQYINVLKRCKVQGIGYRV